MKGALTTSSPSPDHKAVVRQEFTQQAQAYAASPLIANPDRLAALVQAVQPQPGTRVLDVATGPGHVAAAFAEAGCEVVGLDLTPAPLTIAEQMRAARGLTNLRFQLGAAEHLPFAEQMFDIVVSPGTHGILAFFCAASMQHEGRRVNVRRCPSAAWKSSKLSQTA